MPVQRVATLALSECGECRKLLAKAVFAVLFDGIPNVIKRCVNARMHHFADLQLIHAFVARKRHRHARLSRGRALASHFRRKTRADCGLRSGCQGDFLVSKCLQNEKCIESQNPKNEPQISHTFLQAGLAKFTEPSRP